jgi:T5orf172 domain
MSFTDAIKEILASESSPMTPQEIRENVKLKYPEFYDTESHKRNVERGNYQNLDHALLAQIYSLVRSNDAFFCDKDFKPMKISLIEETDDSIPFVEDFEQEDGIVYVLTTNTYTKDGKEILKIGFTTQDIERRINQLYTTGVPYQFDIHSVYSTTNYIELEQAIHKLLTPYKLNKSREFFTEDAIPFIERIVDLHKEILRMSQSLSSK